MSVKIEGATVRMLDRLLEIEKQCFKEEAFSKQHIELLLSDYNSISLTAIVNGEIVGFIIGRIDFMCNHPVGHVMTIDVALTHRRSGIGRRLMLELEEMFRQRGARESHLEVRNANAAAMDLYKKLGYKKVAILRNYYGKDHGLYLIKTLM